MTNITIEPVRQVSPEIIRGLALLVPRVSPSAPAPTFSQLVDILGCPSTNLFVAKDGTEVVGMLTLVMVRIATGLRAHIEDVAVAPQYRRQGIGEALTKAAMLLAEKSGARDVNLTSRPSREDAIRLYKRLGFQQRETGCYRYSFNPIK
jgi:ribosomal protein S18 acetylase RimI-like enzyme